MKILEKRGIEKIAIIVVAVILIITLYFTFFFSYTCKDIACYKSHQEKCVKTTFIDDTKEITWYYEIKGKKGKTCEIYVEVLQIKEGSPDKLSLEGQSMNCYLPLKDTRIPRSDISLCHGILKEELQNIIIKKLHSYVVENIGEIKEELKSAV